MIRLAPMTVQAAKGYCSHVNQEFTGNADFAIGCVDDGGFHGCILLRADGHECALAHLYTDGTALVGSLLYGAAWRAAKALGYKQITL